MGDAVKTADKTTYPVAGTAVDGSGITKMVSDDRYCIDVIRQVQAVKAALVGLEAVILDDHIATCVDHALTGSNVDDRREKVEELVAVLGGRKK